MELKKYAIHWSASISGIQYVEAFDEHDAEEQFDSIIHEDGMPDEPVYADFDYVEEVKPEKEKVKKKPIAPRTKAGLNTLGAAYGKRK